MADPNNPQDPSLKEFYSEQQKKSLEQLKEDLRVIGKLTEEQRVLTQAVYDLKAAELKIDTDLIIAREKTLKSLDKEIEKLIIKQKKADDEKEQKDIALKLQEKIVEKLEIELEQLEAKGILAGEEHKDAKQRLKDAQDNLDNLIQQNKVLEKRKELFKSLFNNLLAMTGQLGQQINSLTTISGLTSAFGNGVDAVIRSQATLAKNFSNVSVSIKDVTADMAQFGFGIEEAAATANSLFENMSSFSTLNKGARDELIKNVGKMEAMGVAAGTSTKNFNELNKGLGIAATQVGNVSDKIVRALGPAGIVPTKALGDLNGILPQIGASGQKAIDIYIELSKQAKALGMEVSELTGIVGSGFDTFEGAADKAGKLNAILGGDYLNSVQMLNATEEERVDLLRQAFQATGKDFDSLDRFEKKTIAASLGLKDVNQARKLFGELSIEEQLRMNAEAKSQEELAKAQAASADSMKKLQIAMMQIATAIEPVVSFIRDMIDWMAKHNYITGILFATYATFRALGINPLAAGFSKLVSKLSSYFDIAKKAPDATDGLSKSFQGAGNAAAASWESILAFGAAIMMVGAGIGLAAWGMSTLVASFKELSGTQMLAALAALIIVMTGIGSVIEMLIPALLSFGIAGAEAAPALLAFGATILLIGAGIGLAAWGMSKLVESFKGLTGTAIMGALGAMVLLLVGFGLAIWKLSTAAPALAAVAVSMSLFAIALLGTLIAIKLVKDDWKELGDAAKNAGDGLTKFVSSFAGLASIDTTRLEKTKKGLLEIKQIINDMSGEAEFTAKVNNIKAFSESIVQISRIEATSIEPATRFVTAAKEYQTAQKENTNFENDKLLEAIKNIKGGTTAATTGISKDTPIVIQIDDATTLFGRVKNNIWSDLANSFNGGKNSSGTGGTRG